MSRGSKKDKNQKKILRRLYQHISRKYVDRLQKMVITNEYLVGMTAGWLITATRWRKLNLFTT
jgi:hypothetical protein